MSLFKNTYRIESARRPDWDYGGSGYYFVTINTRERQHFFGEMTPLMDDSGINHSHRRVETHSRASLYEPHETDQHKSDARMPHAIYSHYDALPKAFRGCHNHIVLSGIGQIVADEWLKTPQIRSYVDLDEWIIMPDHLHGIVVIHKRVNANPNENFVPDVETHSCASLQGNTTQLPGNKFGPQRRNLASIIRGFKSAVTVRVRRDLEPIFAWQARFHDHIVRNEQELERIRRYIQINPDRWDDADDKAE